MSASVFAIEARAGKVHAAEWEGVGSIPRPLFHRARRAGMQLRAEFILPTTLTVTTNLVFHSGNWRRGGERPKEKLGCTHNNNKQHTAHCALAHPHPTYRIVIPTAFHFPVECSVDLSHPAIGRVAQQIIITKIITAHVSSTLACHHRKQQQREREQPPRGRAGRPLQGDSCHHVRSYRAAPRSPCWEYNLRGKTK